MIFRHGRHRPAILGAFGAMFFAAILAPVQAQQAPPGAGQEQPEPTEAQPPPGEKFGDWVKRCEPLGAQQGERCYVSQLLVASQNNKRRGVLMIAVGYYGPNNVPGAILRVPLGLAVYLPAGLQLTVPGAKPMRIVFESCLPGGCNAPTKLDQEMIRAMQKASSGTVELVNLRRQKIELPVSFKGFTAGFAALDKG